MDKIDKIFYINLTRRPDRKDHFLKSCNNVKIPFDKLERFEGLDGKTYIPTQIETNMFSNCDFANRLFYNNIVCNQLGHLNLLKEIINRKYNYALICQDDVYFKNDFIKIINNLLNNIPSNSEIINLGFHSYANGKNFIQWDLTNTPEKDFNLIGKNKINDFVCELNDIVNPCSLAYIVTFQGAVNLVNYFNKNGFKRATDRNYNDYCIEKKIFYASIPVLCTGNPDLGSDIF